MSQAQSKAIVRRWYEEVWNRGDLDVIDELVATDATFEDPASRLYTGPEEMREFVSLYRTAFPDTHFDIEQQIAEEDTVVTRWRARGTHEGELMGVAGSGKQVTVTGIDMMRVVDGKLRSGQGSWDALGLLRQLGVVPETIGSKA